MKTDILKNNKGFTSTDIIVAIIIIVLFISIITTAFYNYYMSIQSKNRQAIATNIMIDVIESIEIIDYEALTQETVDNIIENLKQDGTIQKSYEVIATIQKYNELTGNEQKQDLIKILDIKINYLSNKKMETYEVKRLITK